MKIVRTVLGDIDPQALSYTQCHEHIFIEQDKSAEVSDVLLIDDLDKSTRELAAYKRAGGAAIVDAQPVMAGRMAEWQVAASKAAGVHIVASTGFHKTVFYYPDSYIFRLGMQEIAQLYRNEIEKGMIGSRTHGHVMTTAQAGLIKVAVDRNGIYADAIYEKLHTAAAEAQVRTGAPLMCHIEQGADAMEVVDFYLSAGVRPERLWIAHLDRARYDAEFHKAILARGVYLEYDTIARFKYHSDEDELKLIRAILDAGYEDRLLIGLDTTRARLKSYGAKTGLDYILTVFLPYMLENGVTKKQIEKMTVKNPRAALAMEKNA